MKLNVKVESYRLNRALRQVSLATGKTMKTVVKDAAKLATRKAIEMTAPGESGMAGLDAKKRGETAIAQDAMGGVRGANGKTKRAGIFFVANEGILRKFQKQNPGGNIEKLFTRKDGSVWATEKRFYRPNASISEMDAHHAQYWRNGRMTSAGTRDRTIGRTVFIDRMVVGKGAYRAWLRNRQKRIGLLAAGFMAAVVKLKVGRIPAWITRHKRRSGTAPETTTGNKYKISIINSVSYGSNAQLPRIVPAALAAARLGLLAGVKQIKAKAKINK